MNSSDPFAVAVQHYQAGQLAQAESLCQKILAADASQVDALNLLGVVMFLTGRKELALHHLQEAARLKPDFADAHNNLANMLRDMGRSAEAIAAYERCLQLAPQHMDALDNLAKALREARQFSRAESVYRRLLKLRPNSEDAHYRLGLTLKDLGEMPAALESFRQALKIRGNHVDALNHLGITLLNLKRPAEAAEAFQQAIRFKPDHPAAHCNLGNALWELGRLDDALVQCQKAAQIDPQSSQALNNLGGVLIELGRNDEAIEVFQRLMQLEPENSGARGNLAAALMSRGDISAALVELDQILCREPECAEARKNRGIACLSVGDFARGWADYEWRWQTKEFTPRKFAQPAWRGEELAGKTVLVYAEQGFGDSLHFVRYLPLLQARGARVVFECKPAMPQLLKNVSGIDELVAGGQPLPPFDFHAAIMSLPHLLRLPDPSDSPPPPYVFADEHLIAHWKAELAGISGVKVGINWQGRPTHKRDRFRSVPLAQFLPLAQIPNVRLFSLQKGFGVEQLQSSPAREKIVDLGSRLDESTGAFMDTAAVLHNLDLVITCDTALAHLAGALGRPVWLALSAMPDWRWLLTGETTVWYPTMRIFRQHKLGEWNSVFAQISAALSLLLSQSA